MLHLIPRPVARGLFRLSHRIRILWWRWRRPDLDGCRVIALDPQDRVLLVRHTYGSGTWMPPSGGLSANEDAVAAARRELAEEAGLALSGAVLLGERDERLHGARNRVRMVGGRVRGEPQVDGREVAEAGFFALKKLPGAMSPAVRTGLAEWVIAAIAACPRDGSGPLPRRVPARKG